MCGILGLITFKGDHAAPEAFEQALSCLHHRGPDDHGTHHATTSAPALVSLGQTRLSILDLSPAGHQPMVSPRTGAVVVYNGEVYNFADVRARLEAKGYAFNSTCDTEVVLAAYDEWAGECVRELRGMFSIAIYDPRRGQLLLARDRLGIKPLYYYWDGNHLAFSSEVSALAALPALRLDVSQPAIRQLLLHGYIPHPMSIFAAVRKLGAGHRMIVNLDRPEAREERYWDPLDFYASPRTFTDEREILEAVQEELTRAVQLRLISDVPLGAFLSGGVDSSLIVALMRRVHSGSVRTFTVGFREPEWDEAPAARAIAQHLGTEHEEFYLSEENILETAHTVADYYDEPFADQSNIPTLALCRLTRRRVTVALSGDGGDELFWGYQRYQTPQLARFDRYDTFPRWFRRGVGAGLKSLKGTRWERWGHLLGFEDFASYYLSSPIWKPWYYPRLHRAGTEGDRLHEIGRHVAGRLDGCDKDMLTGAIDVHAYLVDDILTKVDRASMSVGLEARVPILDHHVFELAAAIPTAYRTAGGELKHLLKTLLADYVPRNLWERPKQGFAVPLVRWLRTSLKTWAHDELTSAGTHLHDWLDREELAAMFDDHVSGRRDVSRLIWACLQLAGWDRRISRIRHAPRPATVTADT